MHKAVASLVIGAIINDLLDLCNDSFMDPMIQKYAGATPECLFYGQLELRNKPVAHSEKCPVVRYQAIMNNHISKKAVKHFNENGAKAIKLTGEHEVEE